MKAEEIQALVNTLPDEEQAAARELLEKLGDALLDTPPKKSPKTFKLEPYLLAVETSCRLCRSITTSFYHMQETVAGGLRSRKLMSAPTDAELPWRSEKRMSLTCERCNEELLKWAKQDLVTLAIKLKGGAR